MVRKILVTGANGFIGREVCKRILAEGLQVRAAVRSKKQMAELPAKVEALSIGSIGPDTEWENALEGIDTVVHLAAWVHHIKNSASNSFAQYCKVNVMGSEHLAQTAERCGVKRFIFMSSVKANGEENDKAYNESDSLYPRDVYGISKMLAEQRLRSISSHTGMEFVILRPPLVFGPGVKANFLDLIKIIYKGIPLPLSKIHNRRSFIYIENLVDAVIVCMNHPGAAGQTFFVSDNEDISTTDLILKIASALDKTPRLFPFPGLLLVTISKIIGKESPVKRLLGSLVVDITKIKQELGWNPPFTMEYGLQKTAEWFLSVHKEKEK